MILNNEWETNKKGVVIEWCEVQVYTHGLFGGSEENCDSKIYGIRAQLLKWDFRESDKDQWNLIVIQLS